MTGSPVTPNISEFSWTSNDAAILHLQAIDSGASGEVHEVSSTPAKGLINRCETTDPAEYDNNQAKTC
jgi:hypothetical protein